MKRNVPHPCQRLNREDAKKWDADQPFLQIRAIRINPRPTRPMLLFARELMIDSSTLAQVASIIAAFGAAMLFFRIPRELKMADSGEPSWIPKSDWLLLFATLIALMLVVLPLTLFSTPVPFVVTLARAGCVVSTIMLAGYFPSILAHYRLIFGANRKGPRENPEPAEKRIILITVVIAVACSFVVLHGNL